LQKKLLTVTSNYSLALQQNEIDFIDVPLEYDLELFIDPLRLQNKDNEIIAKMNILLRKHFTYMLNLIKENKKKEAFNLINGFSEKYSHGVHLGYSGSKYGKSIGPKKTKIIYNAFSKSNAITTGKLKDIEECILLIKNISYDTISDMIIGFCKEALLEFTVQQAKKHNLETKIFFVKILAHNSRWIYKQYNLPYNKHNNKEEILLVPKNIITHNPRLTIHRAYSHLYYTVKNCQNKELNVSLIVNLKGDMPNKPLTKKELRKIFPERKENIVEFYGDNPDELHKVINRYKLVTNPLTDADNEIIKAYLKLYKKLCA
jgi:hypothetical protein